MVELHEISARDRRHRERRVWRSGLAASALLHLLLFFVWKGNVIPPSPFAAAGPRAGDNRAAAGGLQAINVRTPPTRPIIPPPRPIEVAVEVEQVEFDQEVDFDPSSVLGEKPGLAEGPGVAGSACINSLGLPTCGAALGCYQVSGRFAESLPVIFGILLGLPGSGRMGRNTFTTGSNLLAGLCEHDSFGRRRAAVNANKEICGHGTPAGRLLGK